MSGKGENADPGCSDNNNGPVTVSWWLAFYALPFFVACPVFAVLAGTVESPFREIAIVSAICFGIAGVLMWTRRKLALYAYLLVAAALICYPVFRLWTAGYSHSRIGMIVGGIMMVSSWRSVAEELH